MKSTQNGMTYAPQGLYNVGVALRCNLTSLGTREAVPAWAALGALVVLVDCAPSRQLWFGQTDPVSQFLWIRKLGVYCKLGFIKDQNIIIILPSFLK